MRSLQLACTACAVCGSVGWVGRESVGFCEGMQWLFRLTWSVQAMHVYCSFCVGLL